MTRGGDVLVDQSVQCRVAFVTAVDCCKEHQDVVHLTRRKETTLSFDDERSLVIFDVECVHRLKI